jgi:hypothetical protein
MCRVLEREQLLERCDAGELELRVARVREKNPPFIDWKGQECVQSEELLILNHALAPEHPQHEVARLHRFITADGEIGASGKPDPKSIVVADVEYRLLKKSTPRCELCEGGDMIPPEERFVTSRYRPELSRSRRIIRWVRRRLGASFRLVGS